MEILLVFPPQWCPTQPYLSLPSLKAFLDTNGYYSRQRDLNVEVYDLILSPKYLRRVGDMVCEQFGCLNSGDTLAPEQMRQYCVQFHDAILADEIISTIGNAKAILKDPSAFFDFWQYYSAQQTINQALQIVSSTYYPSTFSLFEFEMKTPLQSMEDVIIATENRKQNPFIALYEEYFMDDLVKEPMDLLGISIIGTSQLVPGLTLARLVKARCPETHVVIGGSILTRAIDKLVEAPEVFGLCFDSVVTYEGERPLLELCRCLTDGNDLASVPNLVYKRGDVVTVNSCCVPENASMLPCPSFDELPLHLYLAPHLILPILSCRGCYWRQCAFCDHSEIYGGKYSPRPARLLVRELATLSQKHRTKYFIFQDEGIAPSHLRAVAEEIISSGLEINCIADSRLEVQLTPEILALAFKAGFRMLYFGLESACDRVLTHMRKGVCKDTAKSVLRASANAGLWNHAFMFFGFPTETRVEALETIDFIFENKANIHSVGHGTFALTRNSAVMKNPQKFGVIKVNENKSAVLGLWSRPVVEKGMSHEEAEEIAEQFSQRLQEEYEDFDIWGIMSREHLFLYVAHHSKVDLSTCLTKSTVYDDVHPSKIAIPLDGDGLPKLKPSVRFGITAFDVADIMANKEKDKKNAIKRGCYMILMDMDNGRAISVTPSAAAIVARCNGTKTLRQISDEMAIKYNLRANKAFSDCRRIIEEITKAELCIIEPAAQA